MIGTVLAAWFDVRTRPLRTLAAVGGMVAAITALITVDAAGALSRRSQDEYLSRQFGRKATLEIRVNAGGATAARARDVVPAVLARHGVTIVSRVAPSAAVVVDGDRAVSVQALLVEPSYRDIRAVDVVAGRLPERTFLAPRVAMDEQLVRTLGYEPAGIVGRALDVVLSGTDATPDVRTAPSVRVVVDAVTRTAGPTVDRADVVLFGPVTAEQTTWLVRVAPADVTQVRGLLEALGRDHREVGASLEVRRVDQDDVLAPLLKQQAATGRLVALVALAVGGLGLLGVAVAGVRERSRDFGVRRALGAPRSAIFGSVLAETLINVVVAGCVAVPLAALLVRLIPRQLVVALLPVPEAAGLPVGSAVRGIVAAGVVGAVAGLIPAARSVSASVRSALSA